MRKKHNCPLCDFRTNRDLTMKHHWNGHMENAKSKNSRKLLQNLIHSDHSLIGKFLYGVSYNTVQVEYYRMMYENLLSAITKQEDNKARIEQLHKTIQNIKKNGVRKEMYVEMTKDGNRIRKNEDVFIACCVLNKPVYIIRGKYNSSPTPVTLQQLMKKVKVIVKGKGYVTLPYLESEYANFMALYMTKIISTLRCMIVNDSMKDRIKNKIRKVTENNGGKIFYRSDVKLNETGAKNLIHELSCDNNGNKVREFVTKDGMNFNGKVNVLLIDILTPKAKKMKAKILDIEKDVYINIENHDVFRLASSLLNKNSVHYLNNAKGHIKVQSRQVLSQYFRKIKNMRDNYCVMSDVVLAMYGVEIKDGDKNKENDESKLRYITNKSDLKLKTITMIEDYDNTKTQIHDPANHFYVHGHKFTIPKNIVLKEKEENEDNDENEGKLNNGHIE